MQDRETTKGILMSGASCMHTCADAWADRSAVRDMIVREHLRKSRLI